jgi:hypothetical protein
MEKTYVLKVNFRLMKKSGFIGIVILLVLAVSGCQKEFSGENPIVQLPQGWNTNDPSATTHEARQALNNLQTAGSSYTFNNLIGTLAVINFPLSVLVPPSCFVKLDNSAVSGNVELKIIKATTYAEMMAHNLATVTSTSLLSTDGMLKISATQNGAPLKIAPGKKISLNFPRTSNNNFQAFSGVVNNTLVNDISWTTNSNWITDTITAGGQPTLGGTRIQIDSMQWVNCDYFYTTTNPTNTYLKVPAGFGNTNTVCYAIFKDEKIMVGLYSNPINQHFWQGQSYKVPMNKNITMVAVAKKDNKIYFGKVSGVTTSNATHTIASMEEVTQADLQIRLNSL